MPPDTPTTTTRSRSMALLERRLGHRLHGLREQGHRIFVVVRHVVVDDALERHRGDLAVQRLAAPADPVVETARLASRDDAQLVLALARRRDQCGQLHAFSCRCGSVLRRAAYPLTPRASCNVLRNPVPMRARVLGAHCGGIVDGMKIKAVIPGVSSVPLLPASMLDTGLDFESMVAAGTLLGSGGVIVIDDQTCIVDALWNITRFYEHESCGKCTPCREGTYWMSEVFERLESGHGRERDIDLLW